MEYGASPPSEMAHAFSDVSWLLDFRVVDAQGSFKEALYEVDIFSHLRTEVEAIFHGVNSWDDMQVLFMRLTDLAQSRAAALGNSNEMVQQLAHAQKDLEMRYNHLHQVAVDVRCENFKKPLIPSTAPRETNPVGFVLAPATPAAGALAGAPPLPAASSNGVETIMHAAQQNNKIPRHDIALGHSVEPPAMDYGASPASEMAHAFLPPLPAASSNGVAPPVAVQAGAPPPPPPTGSSTGVEPPPAAPSTPAVVLTYEELTAMRKAQGVGGKSARLKQRELRAQLLPTGTFGRDLTHDGWN